jgi:hypothetical protein
MNPPSDIATQAAAQAWCEEETKHIAMIPELALQFARILDVWIDEARRYSSDADFYRKLIEHCAEALGPEAYTANDGVIHPDPICLNVPMLVQKLVQERKSKKEQLYQCTDDAKLNCDSINCTIRGPHSHSWGPHADCGYHKGVRCLPVEVINAEKSK